jgi:effector-binding domain-containing protein
MVKYVESRRIAGSPTNQKRRLPMLRTRLAATLAVAWALTAGAAQAQQPAEPMPPPAPAQGAAVPSPLQPGDAFGEEVTLPAGTIVSVGGHTTWDTAFDTLVASFKTLQAYLDKQGLKASGPAMTIYTETDDTGFGFRAALPIAEAPKETPTGEITVGPAPSGRALKFVHRGSYDSMDTTYEAITNYLDDKRLEAKDLFVEEYTTNPVTSNPDRLVVNVYVPVK